MSTVLVRQAVKHRRPLRRAALTALTVLLIVGWLLVQLLMGAVRGFLGQQTTPPAVAAQTCAGNTAVAATAQLRNAGLVASVGAALGVSQQGQIIALATSLVESGLGGLMNTASRAVPESIQYPNDGIVAGDHDSVGLFQQRAGWGSVEQRMNPTYSATKFYTALLAVRGWESMAPGDAAQAVQRSAYPGRYADQMGKAAVLLAGAPLVQPCAAPAGGGGTFTDGVSGRPLPRANPRSVQDAIAWARGQAAAGTGGWYRRCLAFVAQAYGWSYSGTQYAIDEYTAVGPEFRHDGDRNPPPGALLFWETGSRAGHIALYLGGGEIASNDIVTNGQISVVPADQIEKKWGSKYVGWTENYWPKAG